MPSMTLLLVALVAGVVAITVVQVAVYYYLLDGGRATADRQDHGQGGPDPPSRGRPTTAGGDEGEQTRRCPECDRPNAADSMYTFCRHCGAKLS